MITYAKFQVVLYILTAMVYTKCRYKTLALQHTLAIYNRMRCNVMHFQSIFLIKRLITMFANERLFRRMRPKMRVESGPQCETFGTNFTLKGALPGMSVNVSLQISFLVKTLTTIGTVVHMRVRMRAHVVIEVGQLLESAPALRTLMRFFASVRIMMDAFVDFLVKSLAAKIALVRFVVGVRLHVRAQV